MQSSNNSIKELLDLWTADVLRHQATAPFSDPDDLHNVIDSIEEGDAPWYSFQVSYQGVRPNDQENVPSWMNHKYEVWHRDPRKVVHDLLATSEFDGSFDYTPYREFAEGKRRWSDFMSGNWAWKQAVCNLQPSHTLHY